MMDKYHDFIRNHATPRWRIHNLVVGVLIATALFWSTKAELDQVAVATGEVIPEGRVKVVQHLEGGIVSAIKVLEGTRVSLGQPLIVLDLATAGINGDELRVRLDELMISLARLNAEADNTALIIPKELVSRRQELAASEARLYEFRSKELQKNRGIIELQAEQKRKELIELKARQYAAIQDLKLSQDELAMKERLLENDLTSKIVVLKVRQEVEHLRGELDIIKKTQPRVQAALGEYKARKEELVLRFRRESSELVVETNREIGRLRERLLMADDQQQRAVIRSPIEGVVKNLRFTTVGGVVRSGEPIMEIVPSAEALVIEVRLSPSDRGYIAVGQDARVKISAYDFVRYGSLDGKVISIAADTNINKQQGAYYKVTLRTSKNFLGDDEATYRIQPGMQAIVDISVGKQTVADYLLRPILKIRHEAFREP